MLFDANVRTVNEHLGNIYQNGELRQEATVRKFRTVQTEGNREVARNVESDFDKQIRRLLEGA